MYEQHIPEEVKEAIRHNSLILFIGSGYSRNLRLPNWIELAGKFVDALAEKDPSLVSLKTEANKPNANALEILSVLFGKGYGDTCKRMLREVIDVDLSRLDLRNQEKIWKLSSKIITTNYDRALESAITDELKDDVDVFTATSNAFGLARTEDISYLFKIHGDIARPEGCVLFREDYDKLYKYNHQYLEQLKGICANSTLLFIGYSISDIEIERILKNVGTIFHRGTRHFFLSPRDNAFARLGIKTIRIENFDQLVPYLDELIAYRETIQSALRRIVVKVAEDYAGKTSLIDQFSKHSAIDAAKQSFLETEDKKAILLLEPCESVPASENQARIAAIVDAGLEEPLKSFLLSKRKAKLYMNWAYFQHLENNPPNIDLDLAQEYFEQALGVSGDLFEENDPELFGLYNAIGECSLRQGHLEEADRYFRKALGMSREKEYPEKPSHANIAYTNLGALEERKGNSLLALEYLQKGLDVLKQSGIEIRPGQLRPVASQLIRLGRDREAVELFDQIMLSEKESDLMLAYDCQSLGLAHARLKQYREAITAYKQAIDLFFAYYGEENKNFLIFYNEIGHCYVQCREYEQGIAYLTKSVALETNDQSIFIARNNIGDAYFESGNFAMAKKSFEESFVFLQSWIKEAKYPEAYAYCREKIKLTSERLHPGTGNNDRSPT
jgi:tetratricopeptide (TPR) repeat protein